MDRSAPKHAPLTAFIDFEEDAALPPLDRSALQSYAECPAMARFIETGRVLNRSKAMDVGNEVHAAFSEATDEYVQSDAAIGERDLVDVVRGRLMKSRPDLQPEAIDAAWHTAWPWAKFLYSIHPANIVKFDGGEGRRSGQLAHNIDFLGVAVTSEVDLLHAGPSKKILHEVDYKSGRTAHGATAVANSFQFQMHAYLVLANVPDVDALEVSIWETRRGKPNLPVMFTREEFPQYEMRIMQAAQFWKAYHDKEPESCPAWPDIEKCRYCPARMVCPIVPPSACRHDPAAFVMSMIALEAKIDEMKAEAIAYVEDTGADIVCPDGVAFGFDKPRETKPRASIYESAATSAPKQRKSKSSKPAGESKSADDDALFAQAFANLNSSQQPQN
jgi:hypothetical protein